MDHETVEQDVVVPFLQAAISAIGIAVILLSVSLLWATWQMALKLAGAGLVVGGGLAWFFRLAQKWGLVRQLSVQNVAEAVTSYIQPEPGIKVIDRPIPIYADRPETRNQKEELADLRKFIADALAVGTAFEGKMERPPCGPDNRGWARPQWEAWRDFLIRNHYANWKHPDAPADPKAKKQGWLLRYRELGDYVQKMGL